MSNNIVPAVITEAPKQVESGALTDDELNVVAGGRIDQRLADYIQNVYAYTHDYALGARPVPQF